MSYVLAVEHLKTTHEPLARLIDRVGPCRLTLAEASDSLLQALSSAIVSQQLSTKVATVIYNRFVGLYGGEVFPTARQMLETSDETFRSVGLSGQKTRYLKDLAQKVDDGTLPELHALHTLDDDTIIRTLTQVKGVGRWTVQMLLIFRLGRLDVWPVDDLGIRMGAKRLLELPEAPTAKALEPMGDLWKPYRSVAAWYLWRLLELKDFE